MTTLKQLDDPADDRPVSVRLRELAASLRQGRWALVVHEPIVDDDRRRAEDIAADLDGFAARLDAAIEQPHLPTRSEVVERLAKVDKLEAAILDIDAHATALGTDEHGFNAIGYVISIGCLHRALGIIGHPAAPCSGDHEHCPKCGVRPFKGLGGWDSVACQICGGTGRPSSTYGWATEDPEPEVDPAQVGELAKLLAKVNGSAWPTPHPGDGPVYREQAAALLAAGVRLPAGVQVTR